MPVNPTATITVPREILRSILLYANLIITKKLYVKKGLDEHDQRVANEINKAAVQNNFMDI